MPRLTTDIVQRFNNRMVLMYPNVLDMESSTLFCKLCHCNITGGKTFNVHQHFRTLKHRTAQQISLEASKTSPPPVKIELNAYGLDLCTTFLEASIPLATINNPDIQNLLLKYIKETIPNETTLRTEYVPALYEKYVQKLQGKAKNKPIWISITESVNSDHDLVAYFVFGLTEERGKSYLLNMDRLKRADASSLAAFFNYSLQILWPERILYKNIYLVITEPIPYMMIAMQSLKTLYPNMIHLNCLLQSLNRLVQFIRIHFSQIDTFIINCEAVFLRSPHRLHLMRSKYNYLTLPSSPTANITPAKTWLNAAIYYCDNFVEINSLLDMLSEEDDDECIQHTRELIQNTTLETDLMYFKQNFECLSQSLTKLKNRDLTLDQSLATIELVKTTIHDTKRWEFISKFEQIVNENSGLQELVMINTTDKFYIRRKMYKCVPVVSANVEHVWFSYAKNLLENDKTKMLDFKNVKTEN